MSLINIYWIVFCTLCSLYINETLCFNLITKIFSAGAAGTYFGFQAIKCSFKECCNKEYIPQNVDELYLNVKKKLFGQELAIHLIISVLRAHLTTQNPQKALAMAFHGTPGTGKNYVAAMIRDTFYKNGISSQYYHFFNGRSEFPLESKVPEYKANLKRTVVDALQDCPSSLFVFDEVDDMAEGVLDILVPFLDYGPTQVWIDSSNKVIETRKAIYIFLSNTGSQKIVERSIELWSQGKLRSKTSLSDFEHIIALGAFNEKGGFYKSDTISTSLIDHYIPFLPLESEHVILCIKESFKMYNILNPTSEQIDEVMSYVTFGPDYFNLFSKNGCKRIEQKVASIAYRRNSHNEL